MARIAGDHRAAEWHAGDRISWLRAAVLGANDGLVSTSSLIIGVAAASGDRQAILVAGVAGLTAGALSMAAGEYVSVSSQRDSETADLARERAELERYPEAEFEELVDIYESRGISRKLAEEVATELSAGDRLAAHARDELGIDPTALADPIQAAVSSALSFVVGAIVPLLVVGLVGESMRVIATMAVTVAALVGVGVLSAQLGRAPAVRAATRVVLGGVLALVVSLLIGRLTGSVV